MNIHFTIKITDHHRKTRHLTACTLYLSVFKQSRVNKPQSKSSYIPSVEFSALWNLFLQSLSMKLDLPTAASPAKTSLYMRSGTLLSATDALNRKR